MPYSSMTAEKLQEILSFVAIIVTFETRILFLISTFPSSAQTLRLFRALNYLVERGLLKIPHLSRILLHFFSA
jgi:hypothetical protein